MKELIESVLTILIAFALKLVFNAIGVEIDPVIFNTIVAGIVLWILKSLGLELSFRFGAFMKRKLIG